MCTTKDVMRIFYMLAGGVLQGLEAEPASSELQFWGLQQDHTWNICILCVGSYKNGRSLILSGASAFLNPFWRAWQYPNPSPQTWFLVGHPSESHSSLSPSHLALLTQTLVWHFLFHFQPLEALLNLGGAAGGSDPSWARAGWGSEPVCKIFKSCSLKCEDQWRCHGTAAFHSGWVFERLFCESARWRRLDLQWLSLSGRCCSSVNTIQPGLWLHLVVDGVLSHS